MWTVVVRRDRAWVLEMFQRAFGERVSVIYDRRVTERRRSGQVMAHPYERRRGKRRRFVPPWHDFGYIVVLPDGKGALGGFPPNFP